MFSWLHVATSPVDLRLSTFISSKVYYLKFQHHKFLGFYAKEVAAEEDTAKAICGEDLFCQILKHRDNPCFKNAFIFKNIAVIILRNTGNIFPFRLHERRKYNIHVVVIRTLIELSLPQAKKHTLFGFGNGWKTLYQSFFAHGDWKIYITLGT